MNIWDDEKFTANVVGRYLAGESPAQIARALALTRNQVLSKMHRLGYARHKPHTPPAPRVRIRPARGAYGPRHYTASKADAVRRVMATGPKTVRDIVEATDLSSADVSSTCGSFVRQGHAEKVTSKGRSAVYRLLEREHPAMRGQVYRDAEEAYVAARIGGAGGIDITAAMALTPTTALDFEESYRLQTSTRQGYDNSCPKFAHHDRHLSCVWGASGFPALSERRLSQDRVAVCLPITWPGARP